MSVRVLVRRLHVWSVWVVGALVLFVTANAREDARFEMERIMPEVEFLSRRYPMPNVKDVTATELVGLFQMPLDWTISPSSVRTPGDIREYRNGIHQGVDFYDVPRGTRVYPIGPGIIVRTDWSYMPMTARYRRALLDRCTQLKETPGSVGVPNDPIYGDILDQLRGRQVWVYHGRNAQNEVVLSMYAHLERVESLPVGTFVTPRQVIGYVGNSGTSMENVSQFDEVHLHLEIHVGEMYWHVCDENEIGKKLSSSRELQLRRETLRAFEGPPRFLTGGLVTGQRR